MELLAQGRVNEAIAELQRFIRERPSDPNVLDARATLGSALLTHEDYDAARVQFTTLLAARPKDADALSNLGIALAALGRTAEATRAFRDAVAVDPRNGLSQRNLALHLFQQNDFDGAAGPAREAVQLTPETIPARTPCSASCSSASRRSTRRLANSASRSTCSRTTMTPGRLPAAHA